MARQRTEEGQRTGEGGKGPARTMREVLADEANALDSCGDPEDARQLDRALAAG